MSGFDTDRRTYWNGPGATKTFTHPVDFGRLGALVPRNARILDYGSGYGRVVANLYDHGYHTVQGVDFSEELIARGRRTYPHLALAALTSPTLPYANATFDAVLLFAVLTCIPRDDDQKFVIAEVTRVLRSGGILYVSDYPLQADIRNRERYDAYAARHGMYGVFETSDGGIFRHHEMAWVSTLLANLEILATSELEVKTMDGAPAVAFQIFARKR